MQGILTALHVPMPQSTTTLRTPHLDKGRKHPHCPRDRTAPTWESSLSFVPESPAYGKW